MAKNEKEVLRRNPISYGITILYYYKCIDTILFIDKMSSHTALEAGSDEEQRSHGSSYEFVRAYELVLSECTYSSTQKLQDFFKYI